MKKLIKITYEYTYVDEANPDSNYLDCFYVSGFNSLDKEQSEKLLEEYISKTDNSKTRYSVIKTDNLGERLLQATF